MKFHQRGLVALLAIFILWLCLSVFKVHIDIEIVGNDEQHKKIHNSGISPQDSSNNRKGVPVPPRVERKVENERPAPAYVGPKGLEPIYVPWSDYKQPYDKKKEEDLHEIYRFNKYLSDRLPLNRDISDERPSQCSSQMYQPNMGKVSVVLIYYNEAVSVVFRTIWSVINRSPRSLLHEFVLYDDGSVWEESIGAMKKMSDEVSEIVPIRYYRNTTRGGLMRARTSAANFATGDIMVYLDSHCEVLPGWLEPLIEPIYKDRTAVTCPIIDTIEWDTMNVLSGKAPMSAIGSFNVLLNYNWYPIPKVEQERRRKEHGREWQISPIKSPAMAGGLFAINRAYFHELGEYDTQMNVWGGENTEISLRIWTCGGSLLFTPCSKVGHIFRHGYPYDFQGDHFETVLFNYKRVAKVWMDDDEEFYYKLRPMARNKDVGSIQSRSALRQKLQCKPYEWYVDNIAPNLVMEKDLVYYGQMFSVGYAKFCVDHLGNENKGSGLSIGTYPCHNPDSAIDNQFLMVTNDGIFRTIDRCLTLNRDDTVVLAHCYDYKETDFQFRYNLQDKTLIHVRSGKCVDAGPKTMATKLVATQCNGEDRQKWTFTYNKLVV